MKLSLLVFVCGLLLTGCAVSSHNSPQAADQAACTKAADAVYKNNTINLLARPVQTGLRFGAPDIAFQGEEMGALNQRALQIRRCEQLGLENSQPTTNATQIVTPHIVN